MNHSEIESCVAIAKEGNKEELMKILEQYKPFIIKTAKDFYIRSCDVNDLLQIGYIALINAVDKYRTGSNTFSTYAFNTIKNVFKYTARNNSRLNMELSFNNIISPEDTSCNEFINSMAAIENLEDLILNVENTKELKGAVQKLPPGEAELVTMVYYNGVSIKKYAESKGISYQQAIRKRDFILLKLSNFIKNKPVN